LACPFVGSGVSLCHVPNDWAPADPTNAHSTTTPTLRRNMAHSLHVLGHIEYRPGRDPGPIGATSFKVQGGVEALGIHSNKNKTCCANNEAAAICAPVYKFLLCSGFRRATRPAGPPTLHMGEDHRKDHAPTPATR